MIESHLDPRADGLSHAGKYREFTVAEIAEQFRYLAGEGQARSVSATLRILDEQSRGRGDCANSPLALTVPLTLLIVLYGSFALYSKVPIDSRGGHALILLLVLDAAAVVTAAVTRRRRRVYAAQLAEIRRLALETLGIIVGRPEFVPKPLTEEQRKTFAKLRSGDPEGWLQVAKGLAGELAK